MALTLVVYRFDRAPCLDDVLYYVGNIPLYSGIHIDGVVSSCESSQTDPYCTIFRVADVVVDSTQLHVLFAFNQCTSEKVFEDREIVIQPEHEEAITTEVSEWMMMVGGVSVHPIPLSNGNILFKIRGDLRAIDKIFTAIRRPNLHLID